jgi:hypothetical protein
MARTAAPGHGEPGQNSNAAADCERRRILPTKHSAPNKFFVQPVCEAAMRESFSAT